MKHKNNQRNTFLFQAGSSCKIKISDTSLFPFVANNLPRSCFVVPDDDFLSLFYLLYRSNLSSFSVLTDLHVDSPGGFGSPLKKSIDSYLINKDKDDLVLLVNRSCYVGEYPYSTSGHVFNVDQNTTYDSLFKNIKDSGMIRVDVVVGSGTYSLRGSIIDFFSFEAKKAVRVDFSYNTPKISIFDVSDQMCVSEINSFSFIVSKPSTSTVSTSSLLNKIDIFHWAAPHLVLGGGRKLLELKPCKYDSYDGSGVVDFLLTSVGVFIEDRLFVPPWFNREGVVPVKRKTPLLPAGNTSFDNVKKGDLLIHEDFGYCLFGGFIDENEGDEGFVLLEFQDAKITIPVSKLFLLSTFSHPDPISKISCVSKKKQWKQRVSRVSKKIDEFVVSMFNMHVQRLHTVIQRDSFDVGLLEQFASSFKYNDTPDQAVAYQEVVSDLQSSYPMDRLLCADVGFGKTEVAVRAAFCSVSQGGRVVVLAPTSILCYQLFDTFSKRLNPFAVNVEMVSRLKSKKQIEDYINLFNGGSVDVLVCTHRIFSHINQISSVRLLVVDEEHRFGVKQKELFLDLFPNIDVLYMSATPIPRSLQSALSGIKTISTISTPPRNRIPIETIVDFFDFKKISQSIKYEVSRGGQVYFLHNNIQALGKVVREIKKHCPGVLVEKIHGKMSAKEIEKTLALFVDGGFHVLVSTTIIENGLDIPNVNTIIINNAHLFGLSQLHQIRGRVGRHSSQAFAYLYVPKHTSLNLQSKKRLKAIEENVALGSGYSLSTKDLEIRGAGNIFGYSQSGGSSLGFDLYNKLLFRSLLEKKEGGGWSIDVISVDVFGVRAFIPSSFVFEESLRLSIYQNILCLSSLDKIKLYKESLVDRFGKLPISVSLLFKSQSLRAMCLVSSVFSISHSKNTTSLVFAPDERISNIPVFLTWVDSFFNKHNLKHSFVRGAENRMVLHFTSSLDDEDIYDFLRNFLEKFKQQFL